FIPGSLSQIIPIYRETIPSADGWIQTNGPPGGFITDIVIDPKDPDTLYAVGLSYGMYKTIDAGETWNLISLPIPSMVSNIEIDSNNPNILYSNYLNFARSLDGGGTWEVATNGFADVGEVIDFCINPINSNVLYMIGIRFDGTSFIVYKSMDKGENWVDIANDLYLPFEGILDASISSAGNGRVWITVNIFGEGKVFYTGDDGDSWSEVDFGRVEPCWIGEVFVNPFNLNEVWIGEVQKIDYTRPYMILYRSLDGGETWDSIIVDDFPEADRVDFLGVSKDGKLFVAFGDDITYTLDGETFINISPREPGLWVKKVTDIAVDPLDSNKLYIPTRTIGIIYSSDGGIHWSRRDNGIIASSGVLMVADPIDPMTIYVSGYKTTDGGNTWSYLPENGMIYLIEDEWMVDPVDNNVIWYAGDVPYVERSRDGGSSWETVIFPEMAGVFNFCSIYALTQSKDAIYACNNGYGLYRGVREGDEYNWRFLRESEVDYTYTIALDPSDSNIVYSGYSCKPFENKTKIRVSHDSGETWFTGLEVAGEAITSIVANYDKTYAVSTGSNGATIWVSQDKGMNWHKINDYFNLINIHSYASTSSMVYAGIWGGGIYKTMDKGVSWERLPGNETFSVASIAIDPNNPSIIYIADRTKPVVYKSMDSGETWDVFFDAGSDYRRMMWVTVDTNGIVYVSAMKTIGPGKYGSIFKIEDGEVTDITGIIPRLALSITVDPKDSSILYAVLHERGVYKSINAGIDWFEISNNSGLPDSGFSNLHINPDDSNILYLIGGCDVKFDTFESAGLDPDVVNGVYISRDAGEHWENINHGVLGRDSGPIKSLVFDEDNHDVIYVGGEHGVYYSVDAGGHWEKSIGLPYENIGGLIVEGDTLYALTRGAGVFLGHINGDYSITWDEKQRLSSPIYFSQLLTDPSDENTLYVTGYPGGIFKTIDVGKTWMEMNFGMTSFKVDDPLRQGYYALAISRSNPDVLYVGLYHHGVYKSVNGGSTWIPIAGAYSRDIGVTCIAVDPEDENVLYVGSEEGVYRTIDGGETWKPLNEGLPTLDVKTISIDDNGDVLVGTRGYGVYRLDYDIWLPLPPLGGWSNPWPIWDNRPLYQYTSFLINPEDDRKIILGSFPQGIYKSDDDGISWRESNVGFLNDGVFSLAYRPDNPNIVYAGTYNGVSRSYDWGEHWERCSNGWPREQWVYSIVFDPRDNDVMYACSKNGENRGVGREGFHGIVMKSVDGGDNWYPIVDGLDVNQEFYGLVIDKGDPDIIYLATQKYGVFISYDAGMHWGPWNDGLNCLDSGNNGNNVAHPLVLSADGKYIYFGTNEMGIFKRKTVTGGKRLD
ncbi:MAG: hypothetical protein DRN12_06875, partial [Thermoplasmata archaeon]